MIEFDKEFLNKIEGVLKNKPELIGDVMSICSNEWSSYKDHIEKQRSSQAMQAVLGLAHVYSARLKSIKPDKVPWLIDAVKHNYPNGFEDCNCEADKIFLTLFVEACIKGEYKVDSDFVKEVRCFSNLLDKLYKQYDEIKKARGL